MKTKWRIIFGVYVTVAVLLASCAPGNPLVPVTGNETRAVPDTIVTARENSLAHIQSIYETSDLPANANWSWEVDIYNNPDQAGLTVYTFTNGERVITIREPSPSIGKTRITYIDNATNFTWHGFVDESGKVSVSTFHR